MFTMITVTAALEDAHGEPASGTLTATLSETMVNGTEVVGTAPIAGEIVNGALYDSGGGDMLTPFTLAAVDDTGTEPKGATYEFLLELDNADPIPFTAGLSSTLAGHTVDLSALL